MCIGSCLCLCTGLCSRLCTGVPAHLVGLVTVHVLVQMSVNAPALPTAHTRALTSVPRAVSAQGVVLTSVHALVPAQRLCSQACSRGAARVQTQPPASPCSQPPPHHHMDPPRLVRQPCTPPPSRALVRALVRRHHLLGGSSAGPFLGGGGVSGARGGARVQGGGRAGPCGTRAVSSRAAEGGCPSCDGDLWEETCFGEGGEAAWVCPPLVRRTRGVNAAPSHARRATPAHGCRGRLRTASHEGNPRGGGDPGVWESPPPANSRARGGVTIPCTARGLPPKCTPTHGPPE